MEQAQVIEIVKNNNPQRFNKFGDFRFEISDREQEIVTEINGEVETKNTAKVGDYILTGASGEVYILSPKKFYDRYKVVVITNANGNLEEIATAIGSCYGNLYTREPFSFKASWGEEMICNSGDYLVSPDPEFSEAYRIEADTFNKTYKPA